VGVPSTGYKLGTSEGVVRGGTEKGGAGGRGEEVGQVDGTSLGKGSKWCGEGGGVRGFASLALLNRRSIVGSGLGRAQGILWVLLFCFGCSMVFVSGVLGWGFVGCPGEVHKPAFR